jgi:hypothetical protein
MDNQSLVTLGTVLLILVQNFHGVVLPYVIDFANQNVANSKVRQIVSLLICVLIASLLNMNDILAISDWSDAALLVGKITFIWTQAQIVYKQFYEKSDLRIETFGVNIIK